MTAEATYNRDVDVLYVKLASAEIAQTIEVDDSHYVDVAADGEVVGLEILYPRLGMRIAELLRRYSLEDRLAEVAEALVDALPVSEPAPTVATVAYPGVAAYALVVRELHGAPVVGAAHSSGAAAPPLVFG